MKKLLVWDGDESLWNGTVIEGIDGVTLPEGRFELCQELFNRGVVQSIASYNVLSDVEAMLHKFGLANFFLAPQAEFGGANKAEMISKIVAELNLSKYSDVVFIDDNVHNIAEVKALLPDVNTAFPQEIDEVVGRWFTKDSYTAEDKDRVRMYRSEVARRESGAAFKGDKVEFLRSLALKAKISCPTEEQMPRVMQLVERANRLAAKNPLLYHPDFDYGDLEQQDMMVLTAEDNFGNYGLTGVANITPYEDGDAVSINLFVISCRLQGKGLGSTFLGTILNTYIGNTVYMIYKATNYNAGIKSLLDWYKFEYTDTNDDVVIASKTIEILVELPDWVEVIDGN